MSLLSAGGTAVWVIETGALALSEDGGGWVNQYQTLITGILAVGAALATIWWMREGTRQAAKLEQEKRRRDLEAARARLPIALSATCAYARQCGAQLRTLVSKTNPKLLAEPGLVEVPPDFRPDNLPDDAIMIFGECIRAAEPAEAEKLADLISEMQVQYARLVGLPEELHSGKAFAENVAQYALDAAEVYARAAALFEYARRGDRELALLASGTIHSALNQIGFHIGDFPQLDARVERRRRREAKAEDVTASPLT